MQGRGHGKGKSMPETGLRSLGQGSRIRARNGEGRAGSRRGVPKMETKVVERWDTRWKVLEGAGVMGTCGSEFRCYTECNKKHLRMVFLNIKEVQIFSVGVRLTFTLTRCVVIIIKVGSN